MKTEKTPKAPHFRNNSFAKFADMWTDSGVLVAFDQQSDDILARLSIAQCADTAV